MLGSAARRPSLAPGGVLAGPWVRNELWRRARAVPSLDLRFADNKSLVDATTGQNLVTFTRASSGTYVDSDGLIKTATTNLATNSEDAAAAFTTNTATITANQIAAPTGAVTADQVTGSTGSANKFLTRNISATQTGAYTFSIYLKAGTESSVVVRLTEGGANGLRVSANLGNGTVSVANEGTTASGQTGTINNVGDGWYRVTASCSFSSLPFSVVQPQIWLNTFGSVSLTTDFYLWGAQLEQSSTVGEYIPTTSTINSAPRFDHNPTTGESLGLLVEEQRTNSIRNNTMVGAVAGTPGTLPTNWAATTPANGIVREIIGTGTEDGINYIDIKFSGTNTLGSGFYMDVSFDSGTIAAAQGQIWTESCYVRLIAGSLTAGFSSTPRLILYGGPGFADNTSTAIDTVTNARLATQRYVATRTYTVATTNAAVPRLGFTVAVGGTIDFTLRIGLPQLEQGAFATSVIPTTTATVTRSADVASISGSNFSSWYRQDEGTVFAEGSVAQPASGGNQFFFRSSESSYNNSVVLNVQSSGFASLSTAAGGVFDGIASSSTALSANTMAKFAGAYAANNLGLSLNGATAVTDATATMPTVQTRADIGSDHAGANRVKQGTIKRLTYWPQRLSNFTLQSITQ